VLVDFSDFENATTLSERDLANCLTSVNQPLITNFNYNPDLCSQFAIRILALLCRLACNKTLQISDGSCKYHAASS
jgi:hypothetical protein